MYNKKIARFRKDFFAWKMSHPVWWDIVQAVLTAGLFLILIFAI